uniref:Uncharacterized protein n=1 Tax=Tanacetum cinerariifolium TaxID=118510 RepID=A0A6L2MSI7_TANCI|nr:hypothetical protein [Tanacetum cinerariifolium]
MQKTEEKVDTSKALDASLVDMKSSGTESKEHDTSSRSRNDAHVDDVDIRPIYDEEPMVEVQTTAEINVFAIGQQHTEQLEFNNERETVGLRWVPTGKIFASSTTKVDSEPPNGSNEDITNHNECEQTLDVSTSTLNLSAGISFNPKVEGLRLHDHSNEHSSSKLVPKVVPSVNKPATSRQELESLFHHHITMLSEDGNPALANIKQALGRKIVTDMLHELGEANLTHAYYNDSRTSKDNEDPSWNTSFKTKRTHKTTLALEVLWKTLFNCICTC